jgi:hypothetical protein
MLYSVDEAKLCQVVSNPDTLIPYLNGYITKGCSISLSMNLEVV